MVDWKVGDKFRITNYDNTNLGFMLDEDHKEYVGDNPHDIEWTVTRVYDDEVWFDTKHVKGYYAFKNCIVPTRGDYDLW